ncbi:uncharacterized protein LOC143826469 [Paroedura picta]|uniref:uncharacterized protein LOC143826469 n=1 Tax=Paroedura picta TaxID=143630 RepID=UPI0040565EC6
MADELQDMKLYSRSLEEENRKLRMQGRQMEKENHSLLSQADKLHNENQMLLRENKNFKDQNRQLSTEKAEMQRQLRECEELISYNNADLDEDEWIEITEVTEIIEVTQVSTEFCYEAGPNDEPDWKKPGNKWCASLSDWFFKLVLPGLLFACLALITIVYLVPPYDHHDVWSKSRGNQWNHLWVQRVRQAPI